MKFQSAKGITNQVNVSQRKPPLQDVLIVDADPRTYEAFRHNVSEKSVTFRTAASIDQASLELKRKPADLLIVNVQIQDNAGVQFLARVKAQFPRIETVAVSRSNQSELCLNVFRAGVTDMLVGSVDAVAVQACLARLAERRLVKDKLHNRNVRLRAVCRQLNKARHEISQQVNLLCHDLVKAYQELAEQLNQTQVTGEFAGILGEEVEIEAMMRQTMEWILKRFGPVNAAVFLPDSERNYTLAAYLNYDTNADSMLIDVLGETIIPHAAEGITPMTLEEDHQITDLFGQDASLLLGRSWLGCGAYYQKECLAVLAVFRNQGDPIDPTWAPIIEAIAPLLAEQIARSIRVYQRGLGDIPNDHDGEDSSQPPFDEDMNDNLDDNMGDTEL